jgi:murein DD-endopeptidase MepM/ murein hydrolase activator NlpD
MLRDVWVRAPLFVSFLYAAILTVVHAHRGLTGVVLWWIGPPLVSLVVVVLFIAALWSAWRSGATPTRAQLFGFAMLVANVSALLTFRAYPSSHDHRPSDVSFQLPLDGPVTVAWGGPTTDVNYHVVIPDQRWAYDLLVTKSGISFQGDGTRLDDYYVYGRAVFAAAAGVVVEVRDSEPDAEVGHWQLRRASGNHVIVRVAPNEFLFIAHLQRGSIAVAPGERVRAGQPIGRVGNSGNTSEPHLHLHLQDTPTPYLGEGIPLYFRNYRAGGRFVDRGMPTGGRNGRLHSGPFSGQIVEQVRSP